MSKTIRADVVGLQYDQRDEYITCLMLGDQVLLIPEPDNTFDPNAVKVEFSKDIPGGYLQRAIAKDLKDEFAGGEIAGEIITLEGGEKAEKSRIQVAFEIGQEDSEAAQKPIHYCYDISEYYAYILVSCSRRLLPIIEQKLKDINISCTKLGPTIKRASDGRRYNWYIRVAQGFTPGDDEQTPPPEEVIDQFFWENFEVRSTRSIVRELDQKLSLAENQYLESEKHYQESIAEAEEYERIADSFGDDLKEREAELAKLKNIDSITISNLKTQRDKARVERDRLESELQNLTPGNPKPRGERNIRQHVKLLLPNINFIKNSDEEIGSINDPRFLFQLLGEIATESQNPTNGKIVHATSGWYEWHFSNGHDNQGRLYVKRESGSIAVLVSSKGHQSSDFDYLKNY
jgi:hypothetical protein